MLGSMVLSAWVMGLVGGPHCVAMCGAACAGIARAAEPHSQRALWTWQASRVLGYSVLGALAGGTVQGMGWLGQQTAVLRPVWTMMHVAALLLGMALVWHARQPAFLDGWAQAVWRRARPVLGRLGTRAPLVLGLGWALMPCGLLYSALLVASLSASALSGALIMAAFALGTMVSLTLGPWVLLRLGSMRSGGWGIRTAGAALVAISAWALWMGITQPSGLWCA
ncbi:sulfite exporter TauE/SafE family protein [Tepidimonas charontis]|uniref:Cytochrome C biogenesis protein transmembrane region n=1 Tax=Tepidimonas charontis TaxID=2267262 RepID=A0A554XGG1_9BURK|nr:sulfite exporter TauE/SafE family protein [Tepidimonas charontis]TSE34902.1 Cytochrome C biogenesis protein transmembrane region [Tepidimonas charontis]